MMVKQTRLVFEISDVEAFKLQYSACLAEVTAELGRLQAVTVCPVWSGLVAGPERADGTQGSPARPPAPRAWRGFAREDPV